MKRLTLFAALLLAQALALAGDWSLPLTTSTYTNFVTEVKNRDVDLALGLDPAYTTPTNISTNTIRWSSAAGKWQKWNGTTWGDLATGYAINITGSAATLTTPRTINGVAFDGSANISVNTVAALTFNNAGAGAVSGTTFNGGTAQTISYNTIGAPSTTGTGASGTWGISITGGAASATSATSATTATSATSATTATHLAGGSAGTTPYQTAAGTTAQLPAGTNGYYYRANGAAAPAWEAPATVFSNIKQAASETATGVVELSTSAEVQTGTDATRAVTPAALKAGIGFSKYFLSANQTITLSSVLSVAHGLGARPVLVQVTIKNVTAELGWSVGDEVEVPRFYGGNQFITVGSDATNVVITTVGPGFVINQKGSATASAITPANWKYIVRAWI